MYRFIYAIDFYIIYYLKEMREIIKMIFFWSMFAFWLVVAIRLLIFYDEDKMRSIENELDEIYEEKNREEIEAYKTRIKFMEQWEMDLSKAYYKLLMRYYDILSFEICWKTVEEWEREDRKVSRKKK